ncbi:MAG: Spy/CpxP family protein refolding chaperone [Candidatus Competibacterales bacterium]|nr:Spy/CpxP family protein refolding chaperone [Candidatus Competibacterales bacterium]
MKTAGKVIIGFALGAGLATAVAALGHMQGFGYGPPGWMNGRMEQPYMPHSGGMWEYHGPRHHGGWRGDFEEPDGGRHMRRDPGMMIGYLSHRLDLSAEQTGQLRAVLEQMRELRRDWRDQRHALRNQVEQLLGAPTLDQDQALALITEKTRAVEAQAPEMIAAIAAFTDSLDSTQRQTLAELMARRGPGYRGGHYRGGYHRGGHHRGGHHGGWY